MFCPSVSRTNPAPAAGVSPELPAASGTARSVAETPSLRPQITMAAAPLSASNRWLTREGGHLLPAPQFQGPIHSSTVGNMSNRSMESSTPTNHRFTGMQSPHSLRNRQVQTSTLDCVHDLLSSGTARHLHHFMPWRRLLPLPCAKVGWRAIALASPQERHPPAGGAAAAALLLPGDAAGTDDEWPATSLCRDTLPVSRSVKLQNDFISRNASSSSVSGAACSVYLRHHGSELPAAGFRFSTTYVLAARRVRN